MQLPWNIPGWAEQAEAWIRQELTISGWAPRAALEWVHQRPWSAFARIQTVRGWAYFKAPSPAYRYEAPLTAALSVWAPQVSVNLLAYDMQHGWLLSAHAGETLRSRGQTPAQLADWQKILPAYAEFQIGLAERVEEMLAFSMPDRRPVRLPALFAETMNDEENLRVGLQPGLSAEEYQALLAMQPQVQAWCAQLAQSGIPVSLVHEELHENNVLFDGARYVYTDWSDSSVAHPFFTLIVTLRATAYWLKLNEYGSDMMRLHDAYLEPWTRFQPHAALLEIFPLAYRLGMLNRALSWRQGVGSLSWQQREAYADNVPGWLQDFLNTSPGSDEAS